MAKQVDDDAFDVLKGMLDGDAKETDKTHLVDGWQPNFAPTQQKIFDSNARFILAWGNRGGGKTYGIGHKLVRHCYENVNAFALIIVGVRSMATQGGIWEKLGVEILPLWQRHLGVDYDVEKMDEQRYRYRMIKNMHGGWSKILLISVPYGHIIRNRIKGFEPSIVFVDELTTLPDPDFFTAVVQQIGRRPHIEGAQQYLAACNPDGPSHWVYRRFFQIPLEVSHNSKGEVISKEGEWDPRYAVFELDKKENEEHLNESYYESVHEATRDDPVEMQRMLEGKWVDRPTGSAIFRGQFLPEVHVWGDLKKRVLPSTKFPIIVGYDLGQANNAIVLMQAIPIADKGLVWVIFDEMIYTDRKIEYLILVRELVRRMAFWNRRLDHVFLWDHISDDSAFNQFRPGAGSSYDVLDIERISKKVVSSFKDIPPIRMKAAPKFKGSVESRVRLLSDLLVHERIVVSSSCVKIKNMFLNLESQKLKAGTYDPAAGFKPKRSVYLHSFDALTYPILKHDIGDNFMSGTSSAKTELLDMGVVRR